MTHGLFKEGQGDYLKQSCPLRKNNTGHVRIVVKDTEFLSLKRNAEVR